MLQFESWPPEVGKISFSPSTLEAMREHAKAISNFSESDRTVIVVSDIGYACGKLIAANTATEFTQKRIRTELTSAAQPYLCDDIFSRAFTAGTEDELESMSLSKNHQSGEVV